MRRKLIKQGGTGLTVYVPKKWIDLKGLQAGDEVEVNEEDEKIVISKAGETRVLRKEVFFEKHNRSLLRSTIATLYKAGYDEIILKFKEMPSMSSMNDIISTFTGLEVVSQEKDSITIKCFLRTDDEETEKLINKMFQLTKLVVDEIKTNWDKADLDNLTTLVKTNVIKLRDHSLRMIHASKYGGDKSYDYYDLVTVLEKMADEFLTLAQNIQKNKPKDRSLVTPLSQLLEEGHRCFLKKEMESSQAYKLMLRKEAEKTIWPETISATAKKTDPLFFASFYHLMRLYTHLASRLISLNS
ncbi:hypothetical protein KY359_04135 [Candidatus Woesearchaeota archaeon]|nr:hypothetical protein [Candidatus Woesearchaeota archaeon]